MVEGDQMSETEASARAVAARLQAATEKLNVALREAFEEGLVVEGEVVPTRFDYATIAGGKQRRIPSEPTRLEVHIAMPLD